MFSPDTVGGEGPLAVWRGLTTLAGSWIGGGANQAAMLEVFEVDMESFSAFVAVDIIVASIWMAGLLYAAGNAERFDRWFKADTGAIEELKKNVADYQARIAKIPRLPDTMVVLAVGFAITGMSHLAADFIAPWINENAPALKDYSLGSAFF